jgi:hypothetical protein
VSSRTQLDDDAMHAFTEQERLALAGLNAAMEREE